MRGGATSKEQGGSGNAIVVDSPMAAAAFTLLYQLQYGGDDGKYASDHSDALDDLCESLGNDKDYKPVWSSWKRPSGMSIRWNGGLT